MRFAPVKARFAGKAVLAESGCFEWTRYCTKDGYGRIWDSRRQRMIEAHRVAYELFVGPVPDGQVVMHTCDNPPCVTPGHLVAASQADNVADMIAKRRDRKRGVRGGANKQAKLTEEQVADIRSRYAAGGVFQRELATEYGISQTAISSIVRSITWRQV